MGEIVEFPSRREGCARWSRGQGAITLSARPACAALAMALATTAPALKIGAESVSRQGVRASATILPMSAIRSMQ